MARAPFQNARAKIDRARQVIAEIDHLVSDYKGAVLVFEQVERERINLTTRITEEPDRDQIETALGDVVHNLRAALDYTAVALVELNNSNPKNVHFPFAENASELGGQIKRKKFNRASQEAQDLLRQIGPFKGGNVALRALHDLDLLDKHNDLIPTFALAAQANDLRIGRYLMSDNKIELREGRVLLSYPGTGAALIKPLALRLSMRFDDNQPFANSEIVPVLNRLAEQIAGIVEAFAALYKR